MSHKHPERSVQPFAEQLGIKARFWTEAGSLSWLQFEYLNFEWAQAEFVGRATIQTDRLLVVVCHPRTSGFEMRLLPFRNFEH